MSPSLHRSDHTRHEYRQISRERVPCDRPKPEVRTGWPTDEISSLRRLLPFPSPGDLIRSMIEDVLHGAPGTLRIAGEDRVADGGMDVQASPELAARLA